MEGMEGMGSSSPPLHQGASIHQQREVVNILSRPPFSLSLLHTPQPIQSADADTSSEERMREHFGCAFTFFTLYYTFYMPSLS